MVESDKFFIESTTKNVPLRRSEYLNPDQIMYQF